VRTTAAKQFYVFCLDNPQKEKDFGQLGIGFKVEKLKIRI